MWINFNHMLIICTHKLVLVHFLHLFQNMDLYALYTIVMQWIGNMYKYFDLGNQLVVAKLFLNLKKM